MEPECLRFDSSWGLRNFSLSHAHDKMKNIFSIPLPSSKLILSLILFISNTINQIMFDIMASFLKHKE